MKINLGSGKNYLEGYINIDINPLWKPDICCDVSKLLPTTLIVQALSETDEIIAHDLLEHIPDLVPAMTNCLALLKEGGTIDISVPYYLSLGAWQDPTHVRAFNENSWLYYTDWFWYLGWNEFRFEVIKLDFVLSKFGEELKNGNPLMTMPNKDEWLLTMPKAIDSMRVILRKTKLTDEEKKVAENYYAR